MVMADTVKAVCRVELLVECNSTWSIGATMQQIMQQAANDAEGRIAKLFEDASKDEGEMSCKRFGKRGLAFCGVKKISTTVVSD
jgi:hypothetical protein